MDALEKIGKLGVIPVIAMENADDALPTADALLAGGVDIMEITFRTDAAADAIRSVAKSHPDMLVGAGTVVTLDQCKKAVDYGAKFIVSPGYSEEITNWCVANSIPVTPGCVTPTEIMAAMSHGLKVLKFFPAGAYGGVKTLKALGGPFPSVKFIPTGGINEINLGEFIRSPYVYAVGGSWLCSKKDIASHDFKKISRLCREAVDIVRIIREEE